MQRSPAYNRYQIDLRNYVAPGDTVENDCSSLGTDESATRTPTRTQVILGQVMVSMVKIGYLSITSKRFLRTIGGLYGEIKIGFCP